MPTPSPQLIQLLSTCAVAMSAPTFAKSLVLGYGAILEPRARTVSAALRVMGLGERETFANSHRVLNRNRWSAWVLSERVLRLISQLLVPEGAVRLLVIDATLERRQGKQLSSQGRFRDAVRSTAHPVVTSLDLRWCCVCILVNVPWRSRLWALPKRAPNSTSGIAPVLTGHGT